MLYIIRLIAAIFGSKTAPVEPTAEPAAEQPAVVTTAPITAVVTAPETLVDDLVDDLHGAVQIIHTATRTAKYYAKGTAVAIAGRNQNFHGDYIGFWVIKDAIGAKAILLTDTNIDTASIDSVGLDADATLVIGEVACVIHWQQGGDMSGMVDVNNLRWEIRAANGGNFALYVLNQLWFHGFDVKGSHVSRLGKYVGMLA